MADWLKKGSYGQVPSYLIERQIQMAAQLAEEQVCRTSMISALIAVASAPSATQFGTAHLTAEGQRAFGASLQDMELVCQLSVVDK